MNISYFTSNRNHIELILMISTAAFSFGYIADGIEYLISGKMALLWVNIVSLLLILGIWAGYKTDKTRSTTALYLHIAIITLNLYWGMVGEIIAGKDASIIHLVQCMCVCLIPAMLSGMTPARWLPGVVMTGCLILYVIVGMRVENSIEVLSRAPAFALVLMGIGYAFVYFLKINRDIERDNAQVKIEQENIMHLFDFTPKQWDMIKQGRMSRERVDKLMLKMNKEMLEKFGSSNENTMHSDEQIKNAIRARHPNLATLAIWSYAYL